MTPKDQAKKILSIILMSKSTVQIKTIHDSDAEKIVDLIVEAAVQEMVGLMRETLCKNSKGGSDENNQTKC